MRMTQREALAALTQDRRKRLLQAAYATYNNIGPDSGWQEKTPSKAVFVDVIADQIRMTIHDDRTLSATDEDVDVLWSLSARARRALILEVGP